MESQPSHGGQAPDAWTPPGSASRRGRGNAGAGAAVWQQTLQSRVAVLGTLFLVTGALGLPLLWYSSVFSRLEKGLWSLVAMCYTVALLGVTWAIIAWCYQSVIGVIW
ncbi:MAG: hypothetical protein ACO1RT_12550 [Planctomycetaceae bacterium]